MVKQLLLVPTLAVRINNSIMLSCGAGQTPNRSGAVLISHQLVTPECLLQTELRAPNPRRPSAQGRRAQGGVLPAVFVAKTCVGIWVQHFVGWGYGHGSKHCTPSHCCMLWVASIQTFNLDENALLGLC